MKTAQTVTKIGEKERKKKSTARGIMIRDQTNQEEEECYLRLEFVQNETPQLLLRSAIGNFYCLEIKYLSV